MTAGLYRTIRDDVLALFEAAWSHPDVPVYWRSNDREPLPDPSDVSHFLRNEVDFGRETLAAFGGGAGANLRVQFGSVLIRVFAARALGDEDRALDLMADAMAAFRSQRVTDPAGNDLSFIGEGNGFDVQPTEDGNWFTRGALVVFEYRFRG
jgi:hypothetical protein